MKSVQVYTLDLGHYSGIRALSLDHAVERNLSQNKFAAMSYYEDDYDEQYEEYCIQYEDEKVLYVDGFLSRDGGGELCGQEYRE